MADNNAPDLSIVGDRLTLHPPGVIQDQETPLLTSYARFRSAPLDFLREVSLHLSGSGWRSYNDFIGRNIFYNGFSDHIKALVLKNPRLQSRISELAHKRLDVEIAEGTLPTDKVEERRNEMEAQLIQVADSWTDQMICKMDSRRFIRGAYYFATQLLTRAYHQGIHVSSEEVLRLRNVAQEAERKKQSIIFLPCHRSHVDYVSLQVICYRLGLALPIVVAGDNLNFPVVGPFLQHAGAMWIRRSFGDDALYTTLVQAYLDTLLQEGHNFECFVEGGRSRTGKLLQPKFGILSFLLESVLSGQVEDAVICPVSTQYDKVIEVDSYISELLGQPKPKESLGNFLSSSSVLSLKLGRVDVRFHEPWSLRDFINEEKSRLTTLPPRINIPEDVALKRRLLTTLGYKVLSDINAVSVVMPTALVGTVLLTLRGRGAGKSELVRRVDWLTERVKKQGGRIAHFSGLPTTVVVERALEVLGPNLVGEYKNLPEKTYYAADRFQLSFYRNMTIHLFVSEALVSAALYTKVKLGGGPENQSISYHDLYDYVYFLSQLFRGEFIFPTTPLAENLTNTLTSLESDNIISITRSSNDGTTIDSISLDESERLSGRENYDFYCFLIWPFIEASWLGAISLLMLTPPSSNTSQQTSLPLNAVVTQAQKLGKTLYAQGDISYLEAVNRETLRNAYTRFAESGIISITPPSKDGKIPATVHLTSEWLPERNAEGKIKAQGKLWEYCESISKGRREGKNRRDGNTVVRRIFGLVELVGEGLWRDAGVDTVEMPGKKDAEWKAKRREIRPSPKL
ncbi:acyltransferase-domain-containing protein, partial [Aureobasidium melanogenum]|uniref:Acyltransferase-domain-containing protein n=1 Tax=Aureobasidium melanogenum (strain CBS 110374) TaxID=1043003 RepID=A0A074VFM3_AURM1